MGKDSKSRFKGERVQGEVHYFDFTLVLSTFEMIFFPRGRCVTSASWKASSTVSDMRHSSSLAVLNKEWAGNRNHVLWGSGSSEKNIISTSR